MNRHIRSVAVLGSGVMGSRIAALFASIGVQVLLLDIVPKEPSEAEKAKGLTLESKTVRNRIVNEALAAMLKSKPAALFHPSDAKHIRTGNFEDDLPRIADCDWIIEVVVENLKIKQSVFERVETFRRPGTLVTSNTSGIPIHLIAEGRSEDFQAHFCGTHFFNPPRYLRLLEIIPTKHTRPEVVDFLMDYGDRFLGKTTVLAKDTPAFIANRVGVFGFMAVFKAMQELGLSVDEIDALSGPVMGRPKSATFRTADVVGLDTLLHVARNLYEAVPDDEAREIFKLPDFLEKMVAAKLLGDKTGGGFFKKVRDEKDLRKPQPEAPETMGKDTAAAVNEGKATFTKSPEEHGDEHTTAPLGSLPPAPSEGGGGVGKGAEGLPEQSSQNESSPNTSLPSGEGRGGAAPKKGDILTLNLDTLEYGPRSKPKFATLDAAKPIDDLAQRLRALYAGKDKAGDFYRRFHHLLFAYVSHRVPEISDELYRIDEALKAGFGWDVGAFESWDILGVQKVLDAMKADGTEAAPWVSEMLAEGNSTFYKTENGHRLYYDISSKSYKPIPSAQKFILLEHFAEQTVWKNSACRLVDIGEGVVALSWNTKMNSIGGEVLEGVMKSVALAEEQFKGLVIANGSDKFSAGANVGLIFMFAAEQEYDELDFAVRQFQNTTMRLRYSSVPVVVAPHGMTLGGGCEMCLHADAVQAAAETYIGLVEVGVGLIPGGGGTKELALRASDRNIKEDIELNYLQQLFINIGTAKVATSAHEAFSMGILRQGTDAISMNPDRRVSEAKRKVLALSDAGYTQPIPRTDIKVQGRTGLGPLLSGIHGMWRGRYISDYDKLIAQKLAHVMCGGDLSQPSLVSEQYLLDLEREAFLSLCGQRKTLERLQSILTTGKPLRN